MKKNSWIFLLGLALLAGCNSEPSCGRDKAAFLKNYYSLIDEVREAKLALSDDRWEEYDSRFRAYVEHCYDQYEAELNGKERRLFWSGAMKYYSQRYGKGMLQEIGRKSDAASRKFEEEVSEIWGDVKKGVQEGMDKPLKQKKLELKFNKEDIGH